MSLPEKVASTWLRRIMARFSPEFHRAIFRKRYPHPDTGNMVMFYSLPPEEQSRIHDQWSARQSLPQTTMRRKEFQKLRDKARHLEMGFDPDEEAAAAKKDRLEMAKELKRLKEKKVPPRILKKEKQRLLQQLETRRLQRQTEREKAFRNMQDEG